MVVISSRALRKRRFFSSSDAGCCAGTCRTATRNMAANSGDERRKDLSVARRAGNGKRVEALRESLCVPPPLRYDGRVKIELPASRVAVKICGLTNRDDAIAAVEAGADFLGFNTWKGTVRFIDLEANGEWIAALPRPAVRVALLVNPSHGETERIASFPFVDALQFHGDEDAAFCKWAAALGKPIIRAIRARDARAFAVPRPFRHRTSCSTRMFRESSAAPARGRILIS